MSGHDILFSLSSISIFDLRSRLAMRLFNHLLACVGIVAAASSLAFTDDSYNVVLGEPFVLTWKGNSGAVNLTLANGTAASPNYINPIASMTFLSLISHAYCTDVTQRTSTRTRTPGHPGVLRKLANLSWSRFKTRLERRRSRILLR